MVTTGWFIFGLVCLVLGLPSVGSVIFGGSRRVGCIPFLLFLTGVLLTVLHFVKS
jgi:hypothetical protein